MIYCIPTILSNEQSEISNHFGSSPYCAFYDTESKKLEFEENREHHSHGRCSPANKVLSKGGNAVLVKEIGLNAYRKLSSENIKIYLTLSNMISDAIKEIENGNLKKLDIDESCGGRGCH